MAKKTKTTTCTYCGESEVIAAREDVFPRWICNKLAYFAQRHHPRRGWLRRVLTRLTRRSQPVQPPSYKDYSYSNFAKFRADLPDSDRVVGAIPTAFHLPDVCRECNTGWMSRLENAINPLVAGLLEGKPKSLAPFDQALLGMWAVKTSLNYDAARTPPASTRGERHQTHLPTR